MSVATLEIPIDEGYEVFEGVQPDPQAVAEDNSLQMLGGPLDGEIVAHDHKVLWVVVATKKKGLLALYERNGNRYVYKKTIEGYPDKRKSYSNLIVANIVRTPEPGNWQDSYWRTWTTKETELLNEF